MKEFLFTERLTFVLTIALNDTGRNYSDLDRAKTLLDSCVSFVAPENIDKIIIICPENDIKVVQKRLAFYEAFFNLQFLNQNHVCPVLATNPNTYDAWPKPNNGWYRQQLIKLAVHSFVNTDFYMTLDSDVIFKKRFHLSDIFMNEKSFVNVETYNDYLALYHQNVADNERMVKMGRYKDAERVLKLIRPVQYQESWYGETPVVLCKIMVSHLVEYLEEIWSKPWQEALIDNLPWTEYAIYFLFAEHTNYLNKHHIRAGADTILNIKYSLWLRPDCYKDGRSLETFFFDKVFDTNNSGICFVVQSYLGYEPSTVRKKVSRYF